MASQYQHRQFFAGAETDTPEVEVTRNPWGSLASAAEATHLRRVF